MGLLTHEKILEYNERLREAAYDNNLTEIKKWYKKGAELDSNSYYVIISAIIYNNLKTVKFCIENGIEPSYGENHGLRESAHYGHLDIFKYFHSQGADILDKDVIETAAFQGQFEILKYLVENGADVNIGLEYASIGDDRDMMNYLVEHSADIDKVLSTIKHPNGKEYLTKFKEQHSKTTPELILNTLLAHRNVG